MGEALGVILAGGRGKRMDVLCYERPKPLLPFAGRYRVIDFSLSNCIHSGITSMAALVDYQGYQMAGYLKEWEAVNRNAGRIDVLPPKNGSYKGTADAVYQNVEYLRRQESDKILVLAGDHIYRMDYRRMIAFHDEMKADATVAVIRVPMEETHRFGTVAVNAEGRILNFVEKSVLPASDLASMGIYIFNKDLLIRRLIEDAADKNSPHDFGYAILPGMVKRDRIFAYEFKGYWQDIGTIEAYYEANLALVEPEPPMNLNDDGPVYSICPSLTAEDQKGVVVNSLISPGCVIKGRVENSIISPGVYIDDKAVVRNSIVMAGSTIGNHSVVDRCIVDENVMISEYCYTGFDTGTFPEKRGITVLGRGAKVSAYTGTGRKCKVEPLAQPADFVSRLIRSGSLVANTFPKAG